MVKQHCAINRVGFGVEQGYRPFPPTSAGVAPNAVGFSDWD
jgi:hypothetical protein